MSSQDPVPARFVIELEGLELSKEHMERIGGVLRNTAFLELAKIDPRPDVSYTVHPRLDPDWFGGRVIAMLARHGQLRPDVRPDLKPDLKPVSKADLKAGSKPVQY